MDKLLDELERIGITEEPEQDGDAFVINLKNQDNWGKYFSILESSELKEDEVNELDLFHSEFTFYSKWYNYTLTSDFDNDVYKLTITNR